MQNAICFSTKFGWITATEQKNKLTSIRFKKSSKQGKTSFLLNKLKNNINLFFKGETRLINLPLKIEGNMMQKRIWNELRKIKKGKTKSYGEIAKKFKLSPRYVGKICGQNQHVLAIPCHRVIRSDGSLAGFSATGGKNLKRKLLEFEKNK